VTDYRIWPATDGPAMSVSDGVALNLSTELRANPGPAWAKAIRFYRGSLAIDGAITGRVWRVDAAGSGTFVPGTDVTFALSGLGWQQADISPPVALDPAFRHKVTVHFPDQFTVTGGYWNSPPADSDIVNGILTAYGHPQSIDCQGSFSTGAITNYPATNGNGGNYWVDLVVTDDPPAQSTRRNSFFH
jgi:hypothetical protein